MALICSINKIQQAKQHIPRPSQIRTHFYNQQSKYKTFVYLTSSNDYDVGQTLAILELFK